MHTADASAENEPALHREGADELAAQLEPAGQGRQLVALTALEEFENVPGEHACGAVEAAEQ
jgi:hypothetical protein